MDIPIRKIIHIDMDAFYASVEQLDYPELKGKAIAVGGMHRGVLTTASYEARKYGVRSAMPTKIALQKCPHLIIVKPRFQRYKELSLQIRKIFFDYTEKVEPLSLDEAYLDVTENKLNESSANEIAKAIRTDIFENIGLTASAGISINKFLAKVASDINKPNGQKTIHPSQVLSFLEQLPINKFYGVGKVTTTKMNTLGIFNGKDLKERSLADMIRLFGKNGDYFYNVVRGIHLSEVNPNRIRKSLAVEETFWDDIQKDEDVIEKIEQLSEALFLRMNRIGIKGRSLTLKMKYTDFSIFTRSKTELEFIHEIEHIFSLAKNLWNQRPFIKPVRLLGLSISNLNTEEKTQISIQLEIPFEDFIF
ncbi:MAG TPA: DNA polymerase IV [Edaphocola sp.]|nr:DNA polymerase IV [Edaphocola sp.]